MSIIEAILLGIIQGLTEFLPISSTGHLTLAGKFLGLIDESNPQEWTSFIAVIQIGTLISILFYFRKDICNIVTAFITENLSKPFQYKAQTLDARLGWLVILGTLPVVIIGLGFKDFIEGAFTKDLYVIGTSLIVLAIILAFAEKTAAFTKTLDKVGIKEALIIGIAQAVALIPGSSRSGTTITAGLFVGLTRETAARFSFLLSIPAIFASGMLQFYQELEHINSDRALVLAVGTLVSAISGYLAIDFLMKFLKKNSTFIFIWYRIIIGVIILGLLFTNSIKP